MRPIALLLLALASTHARADDQTDDPEITPPHYLISVGGGMVIDDALDIGGLAGARLDLATVKHQHAWYAEADVYPLGEYYAARIGGVFGFHLRPHYTDVISSSVSGNVRTTTSEVYATRVSSVFGLDVGVSAHAVGGTGGLNLEAGLGMRAQYQFDAQLSYDVVNSVPGMRFAFIFNQGNHDISGCVTVAVETTFDLHRSPLLLVATFGGGPPFR